MVRYEVGIRIYFKSVSSRFIYIEIIVRCGLLAMRSGGWVVRWVAGCGFSCNDRVQDLACSANELILASH
jgi:hypothetical protein